MFMLSFINTNITLVSPVTGSWEDRSILASLSLCPMLHSLTESLPLGYRESLMQVMGVTLDSAQYKVILACFI